MSDTVVMPKELTAENGAKSALMGEFSTSIKHDCQECYGDGHDNTDEMTECEECEGIGYHTQEIPVSWTMIKDIYALAVERLAK